MVTEKQEQKYSNITAIKLAVWPSVACFVLLSMSFFGGGTNSDFFMIFLFGIAIQLAIIFKWNKNQLQTSTQVRVKHGVGGISYFIFFFLISLFLLGPGVIHLMREDKESGLWGGLYNRKFSDF